MLALALHPTETRRPNHLVMASARRVEKQGAEADISLRFEIEKSSSVAWPVYDGVEKRRDELWKQTCFECFVSLPSEKSYLEWNFAHSGFWAAYSFGDYRTGMMNLPVSTSPYIESFLGTDDRRVIEIDFPIPATWREVEISLTAVIAETVDTAPFYWAVEHRAARPDFHSRESFWRLT